MPPPRASREKIPKHSVAVGYVLRSNLKLHRMQNSATSMLYNVYDSLRGAKEEITWILNNFEKKVVSLCNESYSNHFDHYKSFENPKYMYRSLK